MKADISHGQVVNETITTCLHPPTCPIAMSKVAWVCPKPDGTWTQRQYLPSCLIPGAVASCVLNVARSLYFGFRHIVSFPEVGTARCLF